MDGRTHPDPSYGSLPSPAGLSPLTEGDRAPHLTMKPPNPRADHGPGSPEGKSGIRAMNPAPTCQSEPPRCGLASGLTRKELDHHATGLEVGAQHTHQRSELRLAALRGLTNGSTAGTQGPRDTTLLTRRSPPRARTPGPFLCPPRGPHSVTSKLVCLVSDPQEMESECLCHVRLLSFCFWDHS